MKRNEIDEKKERREKEKKEEKKRIFVCLPVKQTKSLQYKQTNKVARFHVGEFF